MRVSQIRLAALAMISGAALSGCAYDSFGDPYGYGYGYGPRSSVSIGIGYGSGYGGYGYGGYGYGSPYGGYGYGYPYGGYGYGGYGYGGYGYDPFGWYGDYYYPGSGIYVYDRNRTRHVWNGDQQRYWTDRHHHWGDHSGTTTTGTSENWSGFDRSRWQNRTSGSGSTSGSDGDRHWSGANHGSWQNRSAVTTSGERTQSSDGHHGRRHDD
ncbi:MAG: hypothetical protein ACJ8FT_02770 [Sphingomonas sp.]